MLLVTLCLPGHGTRYIHCPALALVSPSCHHVDDKGGHHHGR